MSAYTLCELLKQPTSQEVHISELGDLLRSARFKKNASLTEAAHSTRIKEPYLAALEDGDYAQLPGPAYVTGFLRNYARYLGLHPDDVVQEYYEVEPTPLPSVKPVTKVVANGYSRYTRTRVMWGVLALVMLLAGGYAIKQYNDTYAHPYAAPLLTPANLGGGVAAPARSISRVPTFHVQLRALSPVWVRVTADKHRVFEGILRSSDGMHRWSAHRALYVLTYNGPRVKIRLDGRPMGLMSHYAGAVVDMATPSGWQRVS